MRCNSSFGGFIICNRRPFSHLFPFFYRQWSLQFWKGGHVPSIYLLRHISSESWTVHHHNIIDRERFALTTLWVANDLKQARVVCTSFSQDIQILAINAGLYDVSSLILVSPLGGCILFVGFSHFNAIWFALNADHVALNVRFIFVFICMTGFWFPQAFSESSPPLLLLFK